MNAPVYDAVIVGAGLAGLCCARVLQAEGLHVLVVEASDGIGGRVRTDVCEGFLLDRGFQVLLTAYPEARRVLDYDALDLRAFTPGALVYRRDRLVRIVDPLRRPAAGIKSLFAPLGTWRDKLRTLSLRRAVQRGTLDELFARDEITTQEALVARGFSHDMMEAFYRPWLGGVFLERELTTSSRMFEFVFRMFTQGDAALPARGMGAIPQQLADALAPNTVRTRTRVAAVEAGRVHLEDGSSIAARAVVVATEGPRAAQLLQAPAPPSGRGVTCLYFAAEKDPVGAPLLVVDGAGDGPVNNLCVPSAVAPGYAPAGAALVSASVLGTDAARAGGLDRVVRSQLRTWFGKQVSSWRHLATYALEHALPDQRAGALAPPQRSVRHAAGLFVCGDHRDTASIQGAMVSGRRAAEAVCAELCPASELKGNV